MPPLATTPNNPCTQGLSVGLLQSVLEQVDYGLAVVNADTRQLIFANSPAWAALQPGSTLQTTLWVADGKLCARQQDHTAQLMSALAQTKKGRRGLLHSIAVMPLSALHMGSSQADQSGKSGLAYALLAFPKQQLCDTTTVTLFARESGLTGTEGRVLMMVCNGLRPQEIATHQGVQISTVRTQLRSIREKTASDSVLQLIAKVSGLPSMAMSLSSFFDMQGNSNATFA